MLPITWDNGVNALLIIRGGNNRAGPKNRNKETHLELFLVESARVKYFLEPSSIVVNN